MAETIYPAMTQEEAEALDAQIESILKAMRDANERMARDQQEIERLKAETGAVLADLQQRLGLTHVETIL